MRDTPRTATRWAEEWAAYERTRGKASPAHGMRDLAETMERESAKLRALLTEWHEGAYDGPDFLRRVRLILHGASGFREVGHNVKVRGASGYAATRPSRLPGWASRLQRTVEVITFTETSEEVCKLLDIEPCLLVEVRNPINECFGRLG